MNGGKSKVKKAR